MQPRDVQLLTNTEDADVLLHPLRIRIVREAVRPVSAADLGRTLGLPRQKVNYHVRRLADAGVLIPAGEARKGNMVEKRYVASARGFVLSPELLGPLSADPDAAADRFSSAHLMALASRLLAELGRVEREASANELRVPTLSLDAEIRFESAEQRTAFAGALRDAVVELIGTHTSPARAPDGGAGTGRPYRLIMGSYPLPAGDARVAEDTEDLT